jgi:hypothetical protein
MFWSSSPRNEWCYAAHLESHRCIYKTGFFEKSRERVFAREDFIDLADEQTGAAALTADGELGEFPGEFLGEMSAVRFCFRKENADRRIAATEECCEAAVDQDYGGAAGAGHAVVLG